MTDHCDLRVFSTGSWLFALFFLVAAPVVGWAETDALQPSRSCSPLATGSFLTTIRDANGKFASRGLITLFEDGNFVVVDSAQGGVPGQFDAFTSGQGSWRCGAGRSISAVAINFNLPGKVDRQGGLVRLDYSARFRSESAVTGTIKLRIYDLDADPFGSTQPRALLYTFTAQRIEAR